MMKYIKYTLLGTLSLFFIFSCSDVEDLEPNNYESMVRAYAESFAEVNYNESDEEVVTLYATVWPEVSQSVSVDFSFSGDAVEGQDYEVLTSGPVSVSSDGQAAIQLRILNDLEAEGEETIIMTVTSSGLPVDEENNSWQLNILPSDNPVDVEFDNSEETFVEGTDGTVEVELSEALETDLTVSYTTSDLTTDPGDYTLAGTLDIPAGDDSGDISIAFPTGDIEFNETFWIILNSVTGNGQVGEADSVLVTILDNSIDPPGDDIAFVLAWDDLSSADLQLTLWEDTGADTVELVSSNNPSAFESVVLEDALGDGTYLVTATWLSGTATEVEYVAYTATNGFAQGNRKEGTIDMMNEPVFLYTIKKETSTDTGIE